jgi:hypothetical protein
MNKKNTRAYDPYEGVSTEELVVRSKSCDVEGMLRYFCPYCGECFDTATALYVHLEGSGGEE